MAIKLVNKINNTVLDFVRGVPFQSLNKFEVNLSIMDNDSDTWGGMAKGAVDSAAAATGTSAIANIGRMFSDFIEEEEDVTLNKLIRVGSSILMQLYAQSVTVSLPEIETASLVNGVKYIKDIKIPEDIEISFLEDELGLTIRLIEYWKTKIVGYNNFISHSDRATSYNYPGREVRQGGSTYNQTKQKRKSGGGSEFSGDPQEITLRNFSGSTLNFFTEDVGDRKRAKGIEYYKANIIVKPLGVQDESIFFPTIKVQGAFPKSIDSLTFSHDSQEFMIHKVKFSVDAVYMSKAI
jgi:uncharacterized protein YqfB (UPF0267 family)